MPKPIDEEETFAFEPALEELEQIASQLEQGTLSLDESLARFERGVGLLRRCYGTLDAAEGRIAILTGFDAEGNAVTAPFDATATAEQGTAGRRKGKKTDAAPSAKPASDNGEPPPGPRGLF